MCIEKATQKRLAVKKVRDNDEVVGKQMQNEFLIMQTLFANGGHDNLIKPERFFSVNEHYYLVMEIFEGIELYKDVKRNGVYKGKLLKVLISNIRVSGEKNINEAS